MLSRWFGRKKAPDTLEDATESWDESELHAAEEDEQNERAALRERVLAWRREWSGTPAFEALTPEQKDESEFIVETFTEYMYSYHDASPEHWNVRDMEACCLDTLPRKVSGEETYFRCLAPVLAAFFTFLGETGRLRNAAGMAERVRAIAPKILQASADPRNWGFAKSFAMSAMAAGADPTDEAAMNAFMADYNRRLIGGMDATYTRPGPKIGRNDPCPCGSGKKYKKCCGG